jgi:homoserine kinase type II
MWVKRPGVAHCAAVGKALAELHLAADGFDIRRPNALTVSSWRPLFEAAGANVDSVQAGLNAEILTELDAIETHWPTDLPTGVIHADMFPDNVFFLGEQLSGVIDFYFACNDFLAYDLMTCVNAWCFEFNNEFNVTKARAMLRSYHAVRPLEAGEIAALPLLAQGSSLRFFLTRLYDWLHTPDGAMVTKKDPLEYLKKVRFHRDIAGAAAYGVSNEEW